MKKTYDVTILRTYHFVTTLRLSIDESVNVGEYAAGWAKRNCIEEDWAAQAPRYETVIIDEVK